MKDAKSVGRTIGVLVIAQMVGGILVTAVLLGPVIATPPGFLVSAAANPLQLSASVLIGLGAAAVSVAIAITALPFFRKYSYPMALWFLALAIVNLSLAAVENMAVMSLLSLSQAYAAAGAPDAALYEGLRLVVASARNWAHYIHLLLGGGMFLVFYALLYRFALIPRALAALGLVAIALQMIAVSMPLFGQRIVLLMLLPVGLSHLALALWLTVQGLEERPPPVRTGTPRVEIGETA